MLNFFLGFVVGILLTSLIMIFSEDIIFFIYKNKKVLACVLAVLISSLIYLGINYYEKNLTKEYFHPMGIVDSCDSLKK